MLQKPEPLSYLKSRSEERKTLNGGGLCREDKRPLPSVLLSPCRHPTVRASSRPLGTGKECLGHPPLFPVRSGRRPPVRSGGWACAMRREAPYPCQKQINKNRGRDGKSKSWAGQNECVNSEKNRQQDPNMPALAPGRCSPSGVKQQEKKQKQNKTERKTTETALLARTWLTRAP